MAQYTVQLRQLTPDMGWTDEKLGLADYPIYDENYRTHLNSLIRDWYAFEEIGFETPARFAQRLAVKMRLIMPYYNQLYRATMTEFDPFVNVNVTYTGLEDFIGKIIGSVTKDTKTTEESNSETTLDSDTTSHKSSSGTETGHDTETGTSTDSQTTDSKTKAENRDKTTWGRTDTFGYDEEKASHTGSMTRTGAEIDTETFTNYKEIDTGKEINTRSGNIEQKGTEKDTYNDIKDTMEYNHEITMTTRDVEQRPPNAMIGVDDIEDNRYASAANMHREHTHHTNKDVNTKSGSQEKSFVGRQEVYNQVKDEKEFQNRTHQRDGERKNQHDYKSVEDEQDLTDSYTGGHHTTLSGTDTTDYAIDETLHGTVTGSGTTSKTTDISHTTTGTASDTIDKDEITKITAGKSITDAIKELASTDTTNKTNTSWTRKGFEGVSMSQLLRDFAESLMNIDQMILEELAELFMAIL